MDQQQHLPQALGEFAGTAGRALSSFAQNLTTRRYTLPDKSVASQVLMYRQLLHTKCRPGLKLSRDYQETPAQKAVLHMPVSGFTNIHCLCHCFVSLLLLLWDIAYVSCVWWYAYQYTRTDVPYVVITGT